MFLVSFFCAIFILLSYFGFGLLWLLILKSHFQPFTDVQPEIRGEVTRKSLENR